MPSTALSLAALTPAISPPDTGASPAAPCPAAAKGPDRRGDNATDQMPAEAHTLDNLPPRVITPPPDIRRTYLPSTSMNVSFAVRAPLAPARCQPPMAPGPVAGPVSAPCRSRIAIASSTRAPASTVTSTPPARNSGLEVACLRFRHPEAGEGAEDSPSGRSDAHACHHRAPSHPEGGRQHPTGHDWSKARNDQGADPDQQAGEAPQESAPERPRGGSLFLDLGAGVLQQHPLCTVRSRSATPIWSPVKPAAFKASIACSARARSGKSPATVRCSATSRGSMWDAMLCLPRCPFMAPAIPIYAAP